MKIALFVVLLLTTACSFKKNNQVEQGHDELYSEPNAPKAFKEDNVLKRIVIASTNDLHAHYAPLEVDFKDNHLKESQKIEFGGVDIISSYFKILRDEYKNVVLLDSGDIFSGKEQNFRSIQKYYSTLKYDAITVGLGDFNLRLPKNYSSSASYFRDFSKDSQVPLLLSNLYELKTARVVDWKGASPYLLKEIDGVKIGIIGLIPDDIVDLTPVDNRVGLYVESMLQSTLRHARLLRSLGADVIVVLTHQGLNCGEEMAQDLKLPITKVNFDPKKVDACEFKGELGEYLKRLPPQLVDLVIGGRTHQKIANYFNDILVMAGHEDGKSFNYAEFFIDTKSKKIVKEKTVAHQPVYFCKEFFKETNDCYTEDASINHRERVPAKFLGKPVEADQEIRKMFSDLFTTSQKKAQKRTESWAQFVQRSATHFNADIAFSFNTTPSSNSQLMMVEMTGADLFKVLEADYNDAKAINWNPSPFKIKNNHLAISVMGEEIKQDQNYFILSDLDSLQAHHSLHKWISKASSRAYMGHSWNELAERNLDTIEVKMAAPHR